MPVAFVIGRAGSGKTRGCLAAIVAALRADPLGPPVYWLLPRQATFTAQRQLACESGLRGYCRARVLSFDDLAEDILAESGGLAVPEVTQQGRRMILGHLLRKHRRQLRFFTGVTGHASLAAKLEATLAEMQRGGQDAVHLQAALSRLDAADPLAPKLHDLHLLYDAYLQYLGQERLDPHRRLMQVLESVERSLMFRDAIVFVDGFSAFTEFERRVLARLGRCCRQVHVMLLMDPSSPLLDNPDPEPDDLSLFHASERSYRQLWIAMRSEHVAIDSPPTLLRELHRFKAPGLEALEREVFGRAGAVAVAPHGIELHEAAGRREEVDACARRIQDLVARGMRYRDVAVTVRDLDGYHDLISAAFAEHGIPCFIDRRRPAHHHPLVQFVQSALQVALRPWPHDAMMLLLKSGLGGIDDAAADELENYVLAHRIRGAAWEQPWKFAAPATSDEDDEESAVAAPDSAAADASRQTLVDRLGAFRTEMRRGTLSVRDRAAALMALLERFGVRASMSRWIAEARAGGRLEQAGEHEQVWTTFAELVGQLVDLLGDEPVAPAEFVEVMEAGLAEFDLALTPQTVDQVLVGQIDRTRTAEVQAMLVLGLEEGVFPRVPREDSLLADAERRQLHDLDVNVDPDTTRRLLDENLLGYIAFTRPSRLLYLSRGLTDDAGRELTASVFWRRACQTFPSLRPDAVSSHAAIGTPRQLLSGLMGWVRRGGSGDERPWPALYQWLATRAADHGPVARACAQAWPALRYDNAAALPGDLALFSSPLRGSVTRLETFAACPFRHFARYGLDLKRREEQEVTDLDLGSVYHGVLERLVTHLLRERAVWGDLDEPQRRQLIDDLSARVGAELREDIFSASARGRYLLSRVARTLEQVVANQRAAAKAGRFRPAYAELTFGLGTGLAAYHVHTPGGNELFLRGRIDRVDVSDDAAAIIDYKLSERTLNLAHVYYGLSLQLLTYALVFAANADKLTGRKLAPAAAFYMQLRRKLDSVDHPGDATKPGDAAFDLQIRPRGIIDERYATQFDLSLGSTAGRSNVIHMRSDKDGKFVDRARSDGAEGSEFAALLAHVRRRIGALADQIIAGRIDVHPYLLGGKTPCAHCEFAAVCRVQPGPQTYRRLDKLSRADVLERVKLEAADAG